MSQASAKKEVKIGTHAVQDAGRVGRMWEVRKAVAETSPQSAPMPLGALHAQVRVPSRRRHTNKRALLPEKISQAVWWSPIFGENIFYWAILKGMAPKPFNIGI